MKEDKLDQYIEQTLKDDKDILECIDDISIPNFQETIERFRQNLEKSQESDRSSTKTWRIKMKFSYKKLSLVAATFLLVVSIPLLYHINSLSNNVKPNENILGTPWGPNKNVQCPNPLTEVKSEEEAEKKCGFHVEKVNYIPEGYEKEVIVYIEITEKDKLVSQIFTDKSDGKIHFEKYAKIHDLKRDWNEYDREEEIVINNNKVILYYRESKLYKAVWNKNNFAYGILSSKDIEKEEIIRMIENLE